MITNIGHLALSVKDLDKSMEFYCDFLGMQKSFTLYNEDGSVWIQYVKVTNDQFIEFFPEDEVNPLNKQSFKHIALQTDDIYADVERLRANGVKIWSEPVRGDDNSYQAWVGDPDGNPIELMQLTDESLQRTTK
ncbi:MAG: VOC family protein [Clostridia bacterium]|nr:VOC family protein [Clostridia bacterium]